MGFFKNIGSIKELVDGGIYEIGDVIRDPKTDTLMKVQSRSHINTDKYPDIRCTLCTDCYFYEKCLIYISLLDSVNVDTDSEKRIKIDSLTNKLKTDIPNCLGDNEPIFIKI